MIEQVKALLAEQALTQAAIIDDAFDDRPTVDDLDADLWDRFFDDLSEEDEDGLAKAYGKDITKAEPSDLRRDVAFISAVWALRDEIEAAEDLFEDYVVKQAGKRADLKPLEDLLSQLALPVRTSGRTADIDVSDVQILFLDLYLGYVEDNAAITLAIERLKQVVAQRADDPPIVVLMSRGPSLDKIAPRVRDEGELLGCQFRTLAKARLKDADFVSENLHDLVSTRPDAGKLIRFISAWDRALLSLRRDFLKEVRTFDLADYASAQLLKLYAEGEPLGDFMLDLFDQRLHGLLEGAPDLIASGDALNTIRWAAYPPAQFLPSDRFLDFTDSLIFEHEDRTPATTVQPPKLGDVWMAPPKTARKDAKTAVPPIEKQSREVFAVLTQACDLQHKYTDRLLLLKGLARPYNVAAAEPAQVSSAVMKLDKVTYAVDWDPLRTETWLIKDLPQRRRRGYAHVRRLRLPYALQLQQAFIGKLGRVGTAAELPARHAVGVNILVRTKSGAARPAVRARSNGFFSPRGYERRFAKP